MTISDIELCKLKETYETTGKIEVKVSSLEEIAQVEQALNLHCWWSHPGQRQFAAKWGLNKKLAERFAKKGWLELAAEKRKTANDLDLSLTHWIPVARGQVLAEDGGAGVGPYEYDGYSARVEGFIYSYGTREEVKFMEQMFGRISGTTSLPFDIYHKLSCCMLKKFDYGWYMKHWGNRCPHSTVAMDNWVDITPMESSRAKRILDSFLGACKAESENYIKRWPNDGGACGFASVEIPTSDPFGKWVAEQKDDHMAYCFRSYVSLYSRVPGRQSMDYNCAVYRAGCKALRDNGVEATFKSAID